MATYLFNTFGDVVDETFSEVAIDGDSNPYPGASRTEVEKWANRFSKEFVSSVRLKTQEGTSGFETVADTTITAAITAAGTSATIALSTGWPASGLCLIDGLPFTFTRSAETLTISAAPRDIDSGATVQLAYAIPSDFLRPQAMFVEGLQYVLARRGDTENVPMRKFIVYSDYFVLPKDTTGDQKVTYHYYKKWTPTLTSVSTMDVMDMWDGYIIAKGASRLCRITYDLDRAKDYEQMAEQIKKSAKTHFAREDGGLTQQVIPAF